MRGIPLLLLLLVPHALGAQATSPADSARLAARIAAVLDTGELRRIHWGIAVQEVAGGRVLHARNAERRFIPASNLKLVVAAAALHHLGADYRYVTSVSAAGPVRGGTLEGDLLVRGRGDPTISGRYAASRTAILEAWADSLRARGITRITGSIVADATEWPHEPVHGDWEAYDLNWWYAAPVGPLGFNDNAIDFRITAGPDSEPPRITWQPAWRGFHFANRARTVAAGRARTIDFDRVAGTDSIFAFGEVPADAEARTESFAVRDPAHYLASVLAETLAAAGITVCAVCVRVVRAPDPPPAGALLFEHRSRSLPDVLRPVLRTSQNWFAEQLVRTLGREVGAEGSWSAGLAVERRFLHDVARIDSSEFRLRDASGLSGGNLVTPSALARLAAWIAREQPQLAALLPTGGEAETSLRSRLPELRERVRAKTGSIRNVDALVGTVRTRSGRELAFAIFANGTGLPASRVRLAVDEVVRLLAAEH